ncbi:MAG: TlpA family protein disulfide reductase [Planctomycetales bacterium]|nr:TlpA family protein disulfide reductase [Planctomycetales bacterium]
MMNRRYLSLFVLTSFLLGSDLRAEEIKESFLDSGVTRKVGGYRPERAEMDKSDEIAKIWPDDLSLPKYGLIEIGEKKWAFVLDEPEMGEPKLYLDSNGDGDLTNDPETRWVTTERDGLRRSSGSGVIDLGNNHVGAINFYRFDPNDKTRATLKNTLMFYSDYGFQYSFWLDGKEFNTFVAGLPTEKLRLPVDRDGNGRMSSNFESVVIGEPFNFTGTTYQFELEDGSLKLIESSEELEQLPLPPDLRIGKKALSFTATTMEGDEIDFPKSFAGKIVMLDFWATWCGPCIRELPNVKEAYANCHDHGFEILGISFDRANRDENVREFLAKNEMPWPQVYEGKYWDCVIGDMHDVSSIPFAMLIDCDSGEILANTRQLRGKGLSAFIMEKLEAKLGPLAVQEAEEADEPAPLAEASEEAKEDSQE